MKVTYRREYDASSVYSSSSSTDFVDVGALKQLSCSTPAMTAQAQSPEPPSPKASSKDEKNTTSKGRQKKFHRHFPVVDDDEKVLNHYSCALIGDILLQGQLYITSNYFAFYSNVFGYVTKLLIPLLSVQKITKEKTARIIPNAIGITTLEDKHVFGSLMSRDGTYRYMYDVWDRARSSAPIEPIPNVRTPSDLSDSSETKEESEKESVASEVNHDFRKCNVKKIITDCVDKPTFDLSSKSDDPRISYLSKQKLLLFASTLLLVLLFLSAAVLLYRIGKIQHKYTLALHDNFAVSESDDVYNELLQWQTHLHSKSAGAVHSFLDTNLDQIAKVRQSLEALSTLLMPNESNVSHNTPPSTPPTASSDVPKES
ncbi:GRAM domain [Popillia japonica]|uniref:GRAM domain n=1 Tax=Popillia japonica TaxID=7064 RepID=A0AAW1IYR5_POPJA